KREINVITPDIVDRIKGFSVNVNGLVANYDWRDYFDVIKTPIIYILDRNNVIVAKNIQADNIAKIMELLDSGKLKL
ncbi:MAG: hypothetical protein UIM25_03330, partial [Bacteroidales bacterium]|nr:hypothetical protein [Bacteroidales bacterium]